MDITSPNKQLDTSPTEQTQTKPLNTGQIKASSPTFSKTDSRCPQLSTLSPLVSVTAAGVVVLLASHALEDVSLLLPPWADTFACGCHIRRKMVDVDDAASGGVGVGVDADADADGWVSGRRCNLSSPLLSGPGCRRSWAVVGVFGFDGLVEAGQRRCERAGWAG